MASAHGENPSASGRRQTKTNCYLVQGTEFEVDSRYKILAPRPHVGYNFVCSAEDIATGDDVALKKIEEVFEHINITKGTLRELRLFRLLHHENIVQVRNAFITGWKRDFDEIYVVSELLDTDLASTLSSQAPLSHPHCEFFAYQILRGMKYVHSAQVIHRDLKPRSLKINRNCDCDLKICDFGHARVRSANRHTACQLTQYVCTQWYRAPEVLCSWTDYTDAIDVWSIGCILAEMHMGSPLCPDTVSTLCAECC